MPKATDITLKEITVSFEPLPLRTPLKFGGRVLEKTTLVNVDVVVESRDGKKNASGFGSMPLGNVWAWPSEKLTADQTEAAMKEFAEEAVNLASICRESEHPIELIYQISGEYAHLAKSVAARMKLAEPIPRLAQMVAASALDAGLHDAYGRLHNRNSYELLSSKYLSSDLSSYLDDSFKGEYLDQYVLKTPRERMPLYHLVGALDPLTDADITKKVGDGLPETLKQWIAANGLTHLKIKLSGDNPQWDMDRVWAVDAVACEAQAARGCKNWVYSLDFNEKCTSADALLDWLKSLQSKNVAAFDRIQYIEQPLPRDLEAHRDQKVHAIAALKPVVVDESLTDYDALLLARELGYSGAALKTCKGQTEALLLGAACQKFNLFLCVQDLTCPGFSFLHSASLAARLPGVAAVEGNARQYCPAANKPWSHEYPTMFKVTDGTVETGVLTGPGLGF